MNLEHKSSLHKAVLERISKNKVSMKPRWHFALKSALMAVGVVLAALALVYSISFALFALHVNGVWFAPAFGFRGIGIFLTSLPWVLILVAIVFLALLEILVRTYSFAHKRPLMYSALGIALFAAFGSMLIGQTNMHPAFMMHAREGRLPVAGSLYRSYERNRPDNLHMGIVAEIVNDGFSMGILPEQTEIVSVHTNQNTQFPHGARFAPSDMVMVIGERANGDITAFGIRRIDEDMFMILHGRPRPGRPSFRMK